MSIIQTFFIGSSQTNNMWTWGWARNGALGTNDTTPNRSTPVTIFVGGTNWRQVSAGYEYMAAIKTDGTLWTWGEGSSGILGNASTTDVFTPITTFSGGTNWQQVSCGSFHTAAIKTDGTLWTWGAGGRLGNASFTTASTPVTTFSGGTNWRQVSCARSHTAAIRTNGTLWTWGYGGYGRLGNNNISNRNTPVTTFAGGTNWKQVSCGEDHTAAIKTDGTLWTWGRGFLGRLGNNDTNTTTTPVTTFAGGTNWRQVSCGDEHTAAIKTDGTLWIWGAGTFGRLGNGVLNQVWTPVTTFSGGTDWQEVSAGGQHTAAIKTNGTLWTWGYGTLGRLGNGATSGVISTPVTTFAGGTNWQEISAGYAHNLALYGVSIPSVPTSVSASAISSTSASVSWNAPANNGGSTITSYTITSSPGGITKIVNQSTGGTTTITGLSPGTTYTFTVYATNAVGNSFNSLDSNSVTTSSTGVLWTWGAGLNGRLANNQTSNSLTPITTFDGGTNWQQVSSGNSHASGIKSDGTLWTWGYGLNGRLGNNAATDRLTPVTTFSGGTNWSQVSAGDSHTAAIKTDGTLWTWGVGVNGQLGNNAVTDRLTPVTTFAGGTNWSQVSAGSNHTVAVKTDGTLWTWGSGSSGELGNNQTTQRNTPVTTFAGGTNWKQVTSVSSGESQCVGAIKTDGTLWTWGAGGFGRLGNAQITDRLTPVTTFSGGTNWSQVSAGRDTMAAVKTDGTLWIWGYSTYGRLGNGSVSTTNVSTPITTFAGGTNWRQVDCGSFSTLAIKTDGTIWTWGYGSNGSLGVNDTTRRSTPVTTFAGGTNWKQASFGNSFAVAIFYN